MATYLQARRVPALWYRVDELDADVASLFYYLGEAAKTLKGSLAYPLPRFGPEYYQSLSVFTRHYSDSFFAGIRSPLVMVFDNYQDAPEGSAIHDVMRIALKLLPEVIRIFVVSRTGLPPQFSVLEAESTIATVGWEEIRFTLDEVREIVQARKKDALGEETLQRLHRESQGWISAIVMMLADRQVVTVEPGTIGRSSVFNYFAMEVFHKLDPRLREFLLKVALLTTITPGIACDLTGVPEGDAFLAYLHRNHYFTDRYGGSYRFHPLFQEFLLDRAKSAYDAGQLAALSVEAGRLLAKSDEVEEAIRLFLDAGAYGEAPRSCSDPRSISSARAGSPRLWTGPTGYRRT